MYHRGFRFAAYSMSLVSDLKNLIVPAGRKPLKILTSPFKGIIMALSLRSQSQLYLGLFERETYPWLVRLSRDISTAIDIGAGHGEYTIYFIQKTNAAKVFAFEPDPKCITLLHENLRISGLNRSGKLELSTKFVASSDTDQEVQIDSLLEFTQVPCLIKMDVDGAEEA